MERCRCRACGETLYETIRLDGALTSNAFPATPRRDDVRGPFFQCPGCGVRIDLVAESGQTDALTPLDGVVFDRVQESPVIPPWRKPPTAVRDGRAPGTGSPPRPDEPPPDPVLLPLLWHPGPPGVPLGPDQVGRDVLRERARALESWLQLCREQLRAGHLDVFLASLKVGIEMLAALLAEPDPPKARPAEGPPRVPPERAARWRRRAPRGRGAA
jgi:hypothetical protein